MAAENYWRYADARQQQAMVAAAAAAAGMAPAAPVATAATVAAGMPPQAAMAQQAAAPPLKRARPDYGDVPAGQDMAGYYPRENDRAGYHSLRDNEAIGASYDRYLRNGMPSVGANETSRAVAGGMGGYPVDDRRMMGVIGMDSRGMGYGARPEPPLPPDASNTLYIEGLPANCTRREVSHIFRPFVGFREVRLVNKESRHPGGDPHVLCFVDFDNPGQATVALEALQACGEQSRFDLLFTRRPEQNKLSRFVLQVISLTNTIVTQPICGCNSRAFLVRDQLADLVVGVKSCWPGFQVVDEPIV